MAPKMGRPRQKAAAVPAASSGAAASREGQEDAAPRLRGSTVVFTGELDGLTRDEALDKVKAAGAKVMSGLSGKTAFLVLGSHLDDGRPVEETSKYKKYLELRDKGKGCPRLLREADLLAMLQDAGALEGRATKLNDVAKPAGMVAAAAGPVSTPWVDRYAPQGLDDLLGNASAVKKLVDWLRDWDDVVFRGRTKMARFKPGGGMPDNVNARAALVSGPPGIGKSTACRLVAKLHGAYDVQEYNASDGRSQKIIQAMADGIASNRTLTFGSQSALGGTVAPSSTKRVVIIMDEVDGMGAGDRGGNAALIRMIKNTKNPIICICNDHSSPKVRSLAFSCYDIRFARPAKATIAQRAAHIAAAEGLDVEENALEALVESCGNDVRHTLNQLQIMAGVPAFRSLGVGYSDMRDRLRQICKDEAIMMTPFEATKRLLTASIVQKVSINQLLDLFFVDFNLVHLMVHENYLNSVAKKPVDDALLDACARSAELIAIGDTLARQIRDAQAWCLLPSMGLISTVYPAYVTNGFVAFPEFPKFLGNYSKQSRALRLVLELHTHLKMFTTVRRKCLVRSGYLQRLHDKAISSLQREDIDEAVDVMDAYGLQRIHLAEHLPELMQHLSGEDEFKLVDPKVKASLTRELNTGSHAVRVVLPASKKRKAGGPPEGDDLEDDGPAEKDKVAENGKDEEASDTEPGGLLKPAKAKRGAKAKAKPAVRAAKVKANGEITSVDEEAEMAPAPKAKGKAKATASAQGKAAVVVRGGAAGSRAAGSVKGTGKVEAKAKPSAKAQAETKAKASARAQAAVKAKAPLAKGTKASQASAKKARK